MGFLPSVWLQVLGGCCGVYGWRGPRWMEGKWESTCFPLKDCAFLELLKEHQGNELINVLDFFDRNIVRTFFWKECRVLYDDEFVAKRSPKEGWYCEFQFFPDFPPGSCLNICQFAYGSYNKSNSWCSDCVGVVDGRPNQFPSIIHPFWWFLLLGFCESFLVLFFEEESRPCRIDMSSHPASKAIFLQRRFFHEVGNRKTHLAARPFFGVPQGKFDGFYTMILHLTDIVFS